MEPGFAALAQVAATLFGLVLISLVFAYTTAISRIDHIGDFSHFASWVWAAGFSCFLYFSCSFLISFRLLENETWVPALILIVCAISFLSAISLYQEIKWLRIMVQEDYKSFRKLFWVETIIPIFIFGFFQFMIWRALIKTRIIPLEVTMYTALTYTTFFAAMRAVILVGSSFFAIITMHNCKIQHTK